MVSFKEDHDLETRRAEAQQVRARHPDRIPVVVERSGTNVPAIDKKKFLVPIDLTVGQFSYVVRRRLKLTSEQAMFLMLENGTMLPTSSVLGTVYAQYKDDDGFMYVTYAGENAFGLSS